MLVYSHRCSGVPLVVGSAWLQLVGLVFGRTCSGSGEGNLSVLCPTNIPVPLFSSMVEPKKKSGAPQLKGLFPPRLKDFPSRPNSSKTRKFGAWRFPNSSKTESRGVPGFPPLVRNSSKHSTSLPPRKFRFRSYKSVGKLFQNSRVSFCDRETENGLPGGLAGARVRTGRARLVRWPASVWITWTMS